MALAAAIRRFAADAHLADRIAARGHRLLRASELKLSWAPAGAACSRLCEHPCSTVGGDRSVRRRLLGTVGAPPRGFQLRPIRPREHGSGRLVDRPRRPVSNDRPSRRPDLAARRTHGLPARRVRPLWWRWPDLLLLVAQAAVVALGALPVFWLARKHLGSARAAPRLRAAYLLYPPVQWLVLDDFHAVALACPLLLFGFWYLDEDRPGAFAVVASLAMLTKEEIGFAVAGLGASGMRWPAGARAGLAIAAAGTTLSPPDPRRHACRLGRRVRTSTAATARSAARPAASSRRSSPIRPRPRGRLRRPGPRLPVRLLAPVLFVAVAPLTLGRAPGARDQPPVVNRDADVDPLSLHSCDHACVAGSVFGAARIARRRPETATPLAVTVAVVLALAAGWWLGPLPYPGGRRTSPRTPGGRTATIALPTERSSGYRPTPS